MMDGSCMFEALLSCLQVPEERVATLNVTALRQAIVFHMVERRALLLRRIWDSLCLTYVDEWEDLKHTQHRLQGVPWPPRNFQQYLLHMSGEQTPSLLAETFLLVTAASFGPGRVGPRTPVLSSAIQRYPALSEPPTPADQLHVSLSLSLCRWSSR